jgi:hypothetical protein
LGWGRSADANSTRAAERSLGILCKILYQEVYWSRICSNASPPFCRFALLVPHLPQRLRQKTNNVGRHGMSLMAEDDALVAEAVAYRFDTTKPGLISSAINHSVRRQKPLSWHPHKSMLPTHTCLSVASTRTKAMLLDSTPPAFASIPSIELILPFVFFLKLWHVPVTKSHIQHMKSQDHVTKSRSRCAGRNQKPCIFVSPTLKIILVFHESFVLYYCRS